MKKQPTIIISGATATGKSNFAIELAKKINGEIINADIGSFYTPLTIGTAKPDWKNESVPHHLFDILHEPDLYTVVAFRKAVAQLCKEIWHRGHVPILVGGSAFYVQAFFYRQHEVTVSQSYVDELTHSLIPTQQLWNDLRSIDSTRAYQIDPHDRYRIIRALAIFNGTGKAPSEFKQIFDPISSYYFIDCSRDREVMYQRIDDRVHQMIDAGWVDEVKALQDTDWEDFLLRKKMIGYDDILVALREKKPIAKVIPTIQRKTRNYAKRQVTFLKKLKNDVNKEVLPIHIVGKVEQIDLTLCDVGLYINQLLCKIL